MITLNPKPEELEVMETALAEKQARILAEKKEKKKAKASKKELETMNSVDPSMLSTTSSSKRKLDESTTPGAHLKQDQPSKKQHVSTSTAVKPSLSSTHSLTAAVAAKVAEQMAANASMRPKSSAIQSLYNNGRVSKENFMNR